MLVMWVIPFLCFGFIGTLLLVGARRNRASRALNTEMYDLVRATRVEDLRGRLAEAPAAVLATRVPTGLFSLSNRVVLDLSDEQVDLCCFWPPRLAIDRVHRIWFSSQVGWVVETEGVDGPSRLYAWKLDVIPNARVAASRG